MDRQLELRISLQKDEAIALFNANQARRNASDRTLALAIAVIALIAPAASLSGRPEVFLVLPAALALILTFQLHIYSDLTVMAAARIRLERAVNEAVGGVALGYESWVAPIRKTNRYWSVPMAVGLLFLLLGAAVAGGFYVSINADTAYRVAYSVLTPIYLGCAGRAYYEMLKTPAWAGDAFERLGSLGGPPPDVAERRMPSGNNPFA